MHALCHNPADASLIALGQSLPLAIAYPAPQCWWDVFDLLKKSFSYPWALYEVVAAEETPLVELNVNSIIEIWKQNIGLILPRGNWFSRIASAFRSPLLEKKQHRFLEVAIYFPHWVKSMCVTFFLRKQSTITIMTAIETITNVAESIAKTAALLELCSERVFDSKLVQSLVFSWGNIKKII